MPLCPERKRKSDREHYTGAQKPPLKRASCEPQHENNTDGSVVTYWKYGSTVTQDSTVFIVLGICGSHRYAVVQYVRVDWFWYESHWYKENECGSGTTEWRKDTAGANTGGAYSTQSSSKSGTVATDQPGASNAKTLADLIGAMNGPPISAGIPTSADWVTVSYTFEDYIIDLDTGEVVGCYTWCVYIHADESGVNVSEPSALGTKSF